VTIDPTAAAGAPERSLAELPWTRTDELPRSQATTALLATIVENGRLNPVRAVAWGFVRSIDYWMWGLGNGLTSDPAMPANSGRAAANGLAGQPAAPV
jgi:streptomycin 6-kinase